MPSARLLKLSPEAIPPGSLHRQLHGLACELFERRPPAGVPSGVDQGHHGQRKLFACWPIVRRLDEMGGPTEAWWRISWLHDASDPWDRVARRCERGVQIGRARIEVLDVADAPTDQGLTDHDPVAHWRLTFVSPTYFSRSGKAFPLPDPAVMLRSIAARQADVGGRGEEPAVDEQLLRRLVKAVTITDLEISTTPVGRFAGAVLERTDPLTIGYSISPDVKHRGHPDRAGFVGVVDLGLDPRHDSKPMRIALAALLHFASYAGIGAQTTHGLGAVVPSPLGDGER